MVTDLGRQPGHDHVVEDGVRLRHPDPARALIAAAAPRLRGHPRPCPRGCDRALGHAVPTTPRARDPERVRRLGAAAGRALRRGARP